MIGLTAIFDDVYREAPGKERWTDSALPQVPDVSLSSRLVIVRTVRVTMRDGSGMRREARQLEKIIDWMKSLCIEGGASPRETTGDFPS